MMCIKQIIIQFFSRPKDNNINSILITVNLIIDQRLITLNETVFNRTFEKPILIDFNFTNVIKLKNFIKILFIF
jgi:hypothetical protein